MNAKEILNKYMFSDGNIDYGRAVAAMEEYAEQKCIEQRKICETYLVFRDAHSPCHKNIENNIKNLPLATDKKCNHPKSERHGTGYLEFQYCMRCGERIV